MKFLLLSLSLLIPSISWADSVTSGSVGLLIITTGVVDTSRNWGDKFNENTRIVSSSMNTIISNMNVVATDTTTLQSNINGKLNAGSNNEGVIFSTMVNSSLAVSSFAVTGGTVVVNGVPLIFGKGTPVNGNGVAVVVI